MKAENRPAWLAVGGILLSGSIGAVLTLSGRTVLPGWYIAFGVTGSLGLVVVSALLSPRVERAVGSPHRIVRERHLERLCKEARYTQDLTCENGHNYTDTVRLLPGRGWLPEGRSTHLCPECGTEVVPHGSSLVPANRAATRYNRFGAI